MDGINARHTTTNRDPGDGTDITTTWKLTTSQQQQQQGVSCRHSGRSGKHVEGKRPSAVEYFHLFTFCPGSAETSR